MRILLLDDDYIIIEQLKCLEHLDTNWELLNQKKINYNELDLVIVDIFDEKYNKKLQKILEINPKVRTITVSDKLQSNFPQGCEYCNCNYRRLRLIKPIKLKLLYDTINAFDTITECPLMNAFSNIKNLIPTILDQFKNFFYDAEKQTITTDNDTESKESTMEILSLLTLLDKNEIQYSLLNDNTIKLHI